MYNNIAFQITYSLNYKKTIKYNKILKYFIVKHSDSVDYLALFITVCYHFISYFVSCEANYIIPNLIFRSTSFVLHWQKFVFLFARMSQTQKYKIISRKKRENKQSRKTKSKCKIHLANESIMKIDFP